MSDAFSHAIIPASADSDGYVELDSAGPGSAKFRKHILTLGPLNYGGRQFNLDDAFYSQLKRNFDAGVSMVQVPVADARNSHTEDPMRNAGEVVGLEREGNKVYSVVDIRDPDVAKKIRQGTIMGASAMLSLDYKDSRTGKRVGPALLHTCITNRPHVLDLEPYQEVIAATADFDSPVIIGEDEPEPLPLSVPEGTDAADVLTIVLSALSSVVELSAATPEAAAGAVLELAQEVADSRERILQLTEAAEQLHSSNERLRHNVAEHVVDDFIGEGRLMAKSRDRCVELFLSGGQDAIDAFLAPPGAPFIAMGRQVGVTGYGDGHQRHEEDIDSEIMRLGGVAEEISRKRR